MMTLKILQHLLTRVSFRDWRFAASESGGGFLVQVGFKVGRTRQYGRKWYVSAHAVENEVIQTALMAVLTALEHEAREDFRYRGEAIYAPHFAPEALLLVARDHHRQVRPPREAN
jgi:hypothetical protein